MEAEILIDEYDVGAVKIGRDVSVTVNALDVTTEGTLKSFNKQASSMGTMAAYKARVEFEVPENALQGMQVEVRMENQSAKNALLLSVDALQFDESNQVYVLTKNSAGEYVQTYVTTGINDGSTVQILSGLYNGQIVYYSAGMDMMQLMMEMRGRMK
jgi:HlyD family secretion protein